MLVVASGVNNLGTYLAFSKYPVLTVPIVQALFQCNGVEREAGFEEGGYDECY